MWNIKHMQIIIFVILCKLKLSAKWQGYSGRWKGYLDQLHFPRLNIFLRPAATCFSWYQTLHGWHCIQPPFKVDNGDPCAIPEKTHRVSSSDSLLILSVSQFSRACGFLFRFSITFVAGFSFFVMWLALFICSDDVKCVTKFPFLDVFLATFLGDRIMLLKLSVCVSPALSLSANFFVRNLAIGLSRMRGDVR
jgi:hypothetical protein